MTTDGFQTDSASLRSIANTKGQAMIEASSQARSHFADASAVPSSFPAGLSAQQSRLDELLNTLADAAGDGIRIAEDYRERLIATAEQYDASEHATTTDVNRVDL